MRAYCLKIGDHMIHDLMNPDPGQIDLQAIEERLRGMRRWSNDPRALTVHQHRNLVVLMAEERNESESVIRWCKHHDDHEAITGDIPGPLKAIIRNETPILTQIEKNLDRAIADARGIPHPTLRDRERVHLYDKAAETVEWLWVLNQPPARWNHDLPPDISDERLQEMLQLARMYP